MVTFFKNEISQFAGNTWKIVIALCIASFPVCRSAHAQTQTATDSAQLYLIRTVDKNEFTGVILQKDLNAIVLKTEYYGVLHIGMHLIKSIEAIRPDEFVNGKVWPGNTQATRYFWAPNGFGIESGDLYYQNIWILFNQFSFGVTDYFSVSAGIVPLFLFAGTPTPVWVVPKFSIPAIENTLNFGTGFMGGVILGSEKSEFGLLFGDVTVGGKNRNATAGVGYSFSNGDFSKTLIINLSGFVRISKSTYLITENYYIQNPEKTMGVLSFGGRSILNRAGIDYALILPLGFGIDSFIAIPLLGITLPLSR